MSQDQEAAQRLTHLSAEKRALLEQRLLRERRQSIQSATITPRRPRPDPLPLSFAQQRLWMMDQLYPGNIAYHVPCVTRLQGPLDVEALTRSLNEIVQRHETLRTTFPLSDGQPAQKITPAAPVVLVTEDISLFPVEAREREAERLLRAEARRPFNIATGPLLRATLLRLSEREHILMVNLHHIISDGWSLGVLNRELAALYSAFTSGEDASLPDLPIQYADYTVWQREWLRDTVLQRQLDFWQDLLKDVPHVVELPADYTRPAIQTFEGAVVNFDLPAELVARLRSLTAREGATLFMTLLAAFQVLVARYTDKTRFIVGSPISGRMQAQTEALIGFFVNTLALPGDLSGDPTFRTLLQRTRETCLGAYSNQELPFERLVEQLQPERDLSRNPLTQIVFALQNAPGGITGAGDLQFHLEDFKYGSVAFDLMLEMTEVGDRLHGCCLYSAALFAPDTIERLVGHFRTLLAAVAENCDRPISALPLLTRDEEHTLLVEWNATRRDYPAQKCIHQLFSEQAARNPEKIAVTWNDQHLTYESLERRGNQLAQALRQRGVGPEVLVGVYMERSIDLIIGLLGILKAGGAYLPLDPSFPQERLAYVLKQANAPVVLTQTSLAGQLPAGDYSALCLDRDWPDIEREEPLAPPCDLSADNLAYVMYTSGSTGQPKGVCTPHRAVVRLVTGANFADLSEQQVLLHFAPIAFDAATLEIWGALLNGARVVVAPPGRLGLQELGDTLKREGVTTAWLTAGLFHEMAEQNLEGLGVLRQLLAGGDVLALPHVRRVLRELPHTRLINGYGPTETTTFATCYPMNAESQLDATVPIGKAIQNTQVYVLDRHMQLVPVGIAGELYIGGDGLARGYLNRPDLTAERFVPHPFATQPGERLYRTGDIVRYRRDGNLEFLGRADHQVKIRGYRVEPGEIEAVLGDHPAVREAVALARARPDGNRRLVAYVTPRIAIEEDELAHVLREHVRARLPEYMLPSDFVILAEFPLTTNGKIDRHALPEPVERPSGHTAAPRNDIEAQLVQVWTEILERSDIGIDDNFFELGGHSLMATRVLARVKSGFGIELPLRVLFETPTIAQLAQAIVDAQLQTIDDQTLLAMLGDIEHLTDEEAQKLLAAEDAAQIEEGE